MLIGIQTEVEMGSSRYIPILFIPLCMRIKESSSGRFAESFTSDFLDNRERAGIVG
jgi:hypothetical protein